ncbi:MAG: DNA polymerase I [Bacteroides sp.]|nr:DNA polymerase I [Prevotella sp.]MCM1408042.1 DNA polymerase I [Treponema brennaborense]MCM1469018.1 DNA polymerase I [Bacteroides sp.]
MTDAFYILDSYGLIYRAYYAFVNRPLINENGQNVSAVFGFFRNFLNILRKYTPRYAAAAFDSRTPTFRHQMYAEYKATRQKTPEDLHAQIPIIEEILAALHIPILRHDGFEADDIIATMAKQCEQKKYGCRILSGDKDLAQLITDSALMLRPDKAGGWERIDAAAIRAEWGVSPNQMLDILSLIGDSADNVPGVKGIGIKTAEKLLMQYGSLDNIYAHSDDISGAVGAKIRAGKESAYFSKSLIALRSDVPLEMHFTDCSAEHPDYNAAAQLLLRCGLPAVARQYEEAASAPIAAAASGPAFGETISSGNEEHSGASAVQIFSETAPAGLKENTGVYTAVTDSAALSAIIDAILSSAEKIAAFDCETDDLNTRKAQLVGFSISVKSGYGWYIPLVCQDILLASENAVCKKDALSQLERLFLNPDVTLIMHNGKFDCEVLLSNGLISGADKKITCTVYDTMIAAWLLQSDRTSFSLESLAEQKLGLSVTPYDAVVPKGCTFADVPLEQAVHYAAEDADLTWQLWQLFKPRLEQQNLMKLFTELEMPILPILTQMELNGIHIEKKELSAYSSELSRKIAGIQSDIFDLVGHEFNVASPKQLQEVLFAERNLPTGKKTKRGYSTDNSVLEDLAPLDPVPAKILEYRLLAKLLSTYVDALPLLADKDGRIHTNFIQTGTATGRLSSREPNLQNIPVRDEEGRRIRRAFTAKEGCLLISADYSQIELVILAHLSGDAKLCAAFIEGTDVHRDTAARIFGAAPELVTPDMRRAAKTINFGVMYGMSAFRLSNELGIPRGRAADFIKSYFSMYSGIREFMDETIRQAEKTGFVETIFGRRRYIQTINSRNKAEKAAAERIAVNTPIQGSAADIVKKAMIAVAAALEKNCPEAKLLLQVHDELIVECPECQSERAAAIIKTEMEQVVRLKVPLRVSVEIGRCWGEFH